MEVNILFRSCARVASFSQGKCQIPGLDGITKAELLTGCLAALIRSIREAIATPQLDCTLRLTVLDDRSDPACRKALHRLLTTAPVLAELHPITGTGNPDSLRSNYHWARDRCPDRIYFVEDDYLHAPEAIRAMILSDRLLRAQSGDRPVILHPCDYPDRYHAPYPARVGLGSDRHWRTIRHTTGTFWLGRSTLLEHWDRYLAFADRCAVPGPAEEGTINTVYDTVPCWSPLPTLAMHLQDLTTFSPFVPWRSWWPAAHPTLTPMAWP